MNIQVLGFVLVGGVFAIGLLIIGVWMIFDKIPSRKIPRPDITFAEECPKCKSKGHKTTLTENSYACKKCETWWANVC